MGCDKAIEVLLISKHILLNLTPKLFMIRLPEYSSYKNEISLGQGCSGNHDG